MYKWLSGLLSGTSNTLHCSGANSHNFIMFLSQLAFFPNISSLTRPVKQRSRLPPKICISGLQSCRSKLAIMTWSELQRAQRQGHKHKVKFSAEWHVSWAHPMAEGGVAGSAAARTCIMAGNAPLGQDARLHLCAQTHHPHCSCLTFQLLETALNGRQGRGFHWNVFN